MENRVALSPLVSVIIPVYNLEKYLDACLESVETQSFGDFEAIVVNDGSTDGTASVLDSHVARDARIVAVHTPNRGVARARETGIARARGRYLCFLDGDDRWDARMLEVLTGAIGCGSYDIVCCNYKRVCRTYESCVRETRTEDMQGLEFLAATLRQTIAVTVWGRIYRREMFDADIRHYPLRLGQDAMINIQIGCKSPRVRFIDYVGYAYVQRSGSSNHRNFNIDYCQTYAQTVGEVLNRHEALLEGRAEFLGLLNDLRWYLVYLCKSSSPWVGDLPYVCSLRGRVARYRKELRGYYTCGQLWMFDLDRYRFMRPVNIVAATLLRWCKSLRRRLSR